MAKSTSLNVMDQGLNYVIDNVERLILLSADPGSGTAGYTARVERGAVAFTSADITGPDTVNFARRLVYAAKSGVEVTATVNVNHIALVSDTLEEILVITTVANTGTIPATTLIDIASWFHQIRLVL